MKYMLQCFVLLMILFLPSCKYKVDVEIEQKALLETDKEWATVVAKGDMEHVFEYWTEDAVIYPVGMPAVRGKPAIRQFVSANRSRKNFSLIVNPRKAVVSETGDIGYTIGDYQVSADGPDGAPIVRKGRSLCAWQKQENGSWKCNLEIHSPLGIPPDVGSAVQGNNKGN
jgi:ketosteroid isomerase-like protein